MAESNLLILLAVKGHAVWGLEDPVTVGVLQGYLVDHESER